MGKTSQHKSPSALPEVKVSPDQSLSALLHTQGRGCVFGRSAPSLRFPRESLVRRVDILPATSVPGWSVILRDTRGPTSPTYSAFPVTGSCHSVVLSP